MLSSCRKTYYANFSPLSRGGALLIQEHPRRVCQGMRRSMLRRRRAGGPPPRSCRSAPSAAPWPAPPPRAPHGSAEAGEGSGLAQPKQLLHRGEQLPPAGREAEESRALRHQLQQAAGGQQQHRAEAGQLPGQLLRRPIRELIAAHHGGEPLLANQALDLIRGAAEQAGGRPELSSSSLSLRPFFSPSKATTTRLHGALIVDDVLLPLPGGHAGAVLVPLPPLARQVVGGHVLPQGVQNQLVGLQGAEASSRESGRLSMPWAFRAAASMSKMFSVTSAGASCPSRCRPGRRPGQTAKAR